MSDLSRKMFLAETAAVREHLAEQEQQATAEPAAAPAVVEPPAGQTGEVRDQLLHAIDFNYVASLGYSGPEELLAAYEASRTQTVDREALRKLIAAALRRAPFKELRADWSAPNGPLEITARVDDLADAALTAVLPATTNHDTDASVYASRAAEAELYVLLRKAGEPRHEAQALIDKHRDEVLHRAELRRVADETATTETPFIPPAHYRRDDGVECCVHTIPVGPDSCPACRELANNGPAAGPAIVDQVVAALQAKAQALSVEAEEEMRRDLEEQAQVWHEAADLARRTGRKAARSAQPAAGARQDGAES